MEFEKKIWTFFYSCRVWIDFGKMELKNMKMDLLTRLLIFKIKCFDQLLLNDLTCHDVKFSREKFSAWLDQLFLSCEFQKSVLPPQNGLTFKNWLKSNIFPITVQWQKCLLHPWTCPCPLPAPGLPLLWIVFFDLSKFHYSSV